MTGPGPLRGPGFGSYAPDDVGWLLTDLSHVPLEAPVEERERRIQSGRQHYSETLPVEYQPSAAYRSLYAAALARESRRVALALGTVCELVLRTRDRVPVLVSLARAGTPVGVLMRRWFTAHHGVSTPHYAMSIIRGRGLDLAALRYLSEHHDPGDVLFVDGWTGKGAIARELSASLEEAARQLGTTFRDELAVLADPGSCVTLFGTREDFLIPSACLNSTVSGLVSRTVLNDAVIGPGDFHGAKYYAELAPDDVSVAFIDAVSAHFDDVRAEAAEAAEQLAGADRSPTWAGWRAVEEIARARGLGDINLAKPGVGETTRVLLRRVPWRILVAPGAAADLGHVLRLAEERQVPVEEVPGLPYSCVGLIHPQLSAGAVGADGYAAQGTP